MAERSPIDSEWAVTFVSSALRPAFDEAADDLGRLVGTIGEAQWDQPGLGVWSVRDLTGHASRGISTIAAYLDAGVGRQVELGHPFDYFLALRTSYADPQAIAQRARQSGSDLGPDPHTSVRRLAAQARERLSQAGDDEAVATPAGVMRLIDYLPCRIYEITVHSGDLAAALGSTFNPRALPLAVSLHVTAGLVARAPGCQAVLQALNGRGPLPEDFSAI